MIEAREEAGAVGRALAAEAVGSYQYRKLLRSGAEAGPARRRAHHPGRGAWRTVPRGEHVLAWFGVPVAAAAVADPALAKLIRGLPRTLAGLPKA